MKLEQRMQKPTHEPEIVQGRRARHAAANNAGGARLGERYIGRLSRSSHASIFSNVRMLSSPILILAFVL
jgi:hypothetical protein